MPQAAQIQYKFILPETPKTEIIPTKDENQVTITWIKDKETVDLAIAEYEAEHDMQIRGYAEIWNGYCNIYAHDVTELYSTEADTLAHEVLHCFKGSFHDWSYQRVALDCCKQCCKL